MATALEIAALIRSQEKTVAQVVEEQIDLIEQVNPSINAVIEPHFTNAREEARKKDLELSSLSESARAKLPPLFGVPFTCKELIANVGLKMTMGSIHLKDRKMEENATVVDRILGAGAILLGTTNVPEIGFWFECDNVNYGCTKNPYDPRRTSGGSSGGEGAIIGSGASPFGLGSDTGGSIRMPAAFCGIFGHKPSDRVIPLTGHFPLFRANASEITGAAYPFTTLGPLARSADDLNLLFRLMCGPDDYDRNLKRDFVAQPLVEQADQLKIHYLPSPQIHGCSETESDLSRAVKHAARYLKELGSSAEEMDARTFLRAVDLWTARTWTIESKSFIEFLSPNAPLRYSSEFFRMMIGKRRYTLPALLTAFVDQYASDRSDLKQNLEDLASLKQSLTRKLGKNGVILMPVHPRKAPELQTTYTRPFDFSMTAVINALGFPATAVPMGLSSDGLPLSVQVVAAEDQDHLCLSVAKMLELGFGGWQPPRKKS